MTNHTSTTEDDNPVYEDVPENYLEVLAEIRAELGKERLEGASE